MKRADNIPYIFHTPTRPTSIVKSKRALPENVIIH